MGLIQAVILSIVQGITEFIPVSSSGHLVLFQHFLGVEIAEDDIFFEILTHFGTSIAIFLVFFNDILDLANRAVSSDRQIRYDAWRYVGYIVIGSIPVAIVGVFLKDFVIQAFAVPALSATLLLLTGCILYLSKFRQAEGVAVTLGAALIIGLAQALAPMPGISRSGITIVAALLIGVSRPEAGKFSFMLALPALIGASLLDFIKIESLDSLSLSMPAIILSLTVSAAVGYVALKILLGFINRGHLHYFSYYCVAAGVISLILIRFF